MKNNVYSSLIVIAAMAVVFVGGFALAQTPPPANYGQSLSWLERAAESGDAEAQYLLARKMEIGISGKSNVEDAAKWYAKAAVQDYAAAQFRLGQLYYTGKGLTKDLAQAAKWFERAMHQGSMSASYNLGLMHERGLGVEKNFARASALYLRAANVGIVEAQVNLAMLYIQGKGVLKDTGRALMWLEIAKRSGASIPDSILDNLKSKMSPGEVESIVQMALNRKNQISGKK